MEIQEQITVAANMSQEALLLKMEQSVLQAFKNKDSNAFVRNFAPDYIGIANDGVKDAAGEVKGMNKFNLNVLSMTDEKLSFPEKNTGIITYKMMAQGVMNGRNFSGLIHCATVYLKRAGKWEAVLHTESKAE